MILKKLLKYKKIDKRYEIISEVGKGQFSTVYHAYDKFKKRDVAIKTIDKTKLNLKILGLIQNEVDILKVCQHPYVVGLYEIIETEKIFNIVLEYCPGGNLFKYLKKRNFNISEMKIVNYIHKISKAVYSMHNLGIIHRDLKLSNIAVTNDEEDADIRILDFGLSTLLGPGESCNDSYGTPGYAAPEVILGKKYRFLADVWSIGSIAYFLCSATLPFYYTTRGTNVIDVIQNTLNDQLSFDNNKWNQFGPEAKKFVLETMNKDVKKRLTIRQVLEHEWIKKFFFKEVADRTNNFNVLFDAKKKKTEAARAESHLSFRLYTEVSPNEKKYFKQFKK